MSAVKEYYFDEIMAGEIYEDDSYEMLSAEFEWSRNVDSN